MGLHARSPQPANCRRALVAGWLAGWHSTFYFQFFNPSILKFSSSIILNISQAKRAASDALSLLASAPARPACLRAVRTCVYYCQPTQEAIVVRPCQSQLATYTGAGPPASTSPPPRRLERAGRPPTCTGIHPYRFTIIYDHLCILALLTLRFHERAQRSSPSANAVLHICHRRDCPDC